MGRRIRPVTWAAYVRAGPATSRRCHRWCSNSRSRAAKSPSAPPWRARRRSTASEVANDSYSATARAAQAPRAGSWWPFQRRATSRAVLRARMDARASGSAGVSQPAAAYTGSSAASVRSSRCRDQIASQVTRAKHGTMNAPYTA